jgi:hypothetical protein
VTPDNSNEKVSKGLGSWYAKALTQVFASVLAPEKQAKICVTMRDTCVVLDSQNEADVQFVLRRNQCIKANKSWVT